MKYAVEITETLQKTIIVYAPSRSDAIKAVKRLYYDCDIVLYPEDYIDTEIEIREDYEF